MPSVCWCLVVTCLERPDLLALVCDVTLIVKMSLSPWYPGSGVVLDCIDSWSLPSFLLYFLLSSQTRACISDMLDEIEWHHGPSLVALRDGPVLLLFLRLTQDLLLYCVCWKKRTWPLLTFRKSHSTCHHTVPNIVDTRHKKVSWRLCFLCTIFQVGTVFFFQ